MTYTNNMGVAIDSATSSYNKVHHNPFFHYSGLSSSSTTLSDLPGFRCNTGLPHHHELSSKTPDEQQFGREAFQFPLSPPPTNSDPKRSVPLPVLSPKAGQQPSPSPSLSPLNRRTFGFLNSPVMLKHVALGHQAPMTPPPTIPMLTHALPPADSVSIPEDDEFDSSFLGLPRSSSPDQDHAMDPLLSPISPEWTTNGIPLEMSPSPSSHSESGSVLLCGNHHDLPSPYQYPQEPNDNNISPHSRPILPFLHIPEPVFPTPKSAWSISPTSTMDLDYDDLLSTPLSPTSSPFVSNLTLDESDDLIFDNEYPIEKYHYFPHISDLLPELDAPDSPNSPSLRSFSSLPSLGDSEEDDELMLVSPPSPGATLLSLPGADTDDDLFPLDLALHDAPRSEDPMTVSPYGSSSSLLLLEDPNDVPPPRSPSPENFDIDSRIIDECVDPDIKRLSELRRKSQLAERAARQLETTLLEQGAVHQRWETRRMRKREKERYREIGTMLKLKMGDMMEDVSKEPRGDNHSIEANDERTNGKVKEKSAKRRSRDIDSMEKLVATMLMRRHDANQSIIRPKTPLQHKYRSSPLTQQAITDNGSEDSDETAVLDDSFRDTFAMELDRLSSHGIESSPMWT